MAANNYVKVVSRGQVHMLETFDGTNRVRATEVLSVAREIAEACKDRDGKPARIVLWGAPMLDRKLGDPAWAPLAGRELLIDPHHCSHPEQPCRCATFVGMFTGEVTDRRRDHQLIQLAEPARR